jgi:hypothetical protein
VLGQGATEGTRRFQFLLGGVDALSKHRIGKLRRQTESVSHGTYTFLPMQLWQTVQQVQHTCTVAVVNVCGKFQHAQVGITGGGVIPCHTPGR